MQAALHLLDRTVVEAPVVTEHGYRLEMVRNGFCPDCHRQLRVRRFGGWKVLHEVCPDMNKHSQISLLKQSTSSSSGLIAKTEGEENNCLSTNSAAESGPGDSERPNLVPSTSLRMDSSTIRCAVSKERHVAKAGIRFVKEDDIPGVLIDSISEESPFANTGLKPGMRVLRINHVDCKDLTVDQVTDILSGMQGVISIDAEECEPEDQLRSDHTQTCPHIDDTKLSYEDTLESENPPFNPEVYPSAPVEDATSASSSLHAVGSSLRPNVRPSAPVEDTPTASFSYATESELPTAEALNPLFSSLLQRSNVSTSVSNKSERPPPTAGDNPVRRALQVLQHSLATTDATVQALGEITGWTDKETRETFAELGGIAATVAAMKHRVHIERVQQFACLAIVSLATDDLNQTLLGSGGCIEAILAAMRQHVASEDLQRYGCLALRSLAVNNDPVASQVFRNGGIDTIMTAMLVHEKDARIQECGCATLRTLATTTNHLIAAIGKQGGIEAVMNAMLNHRLNPRVQQYGCAILCKLASNKRNKDIILKDGGLNAVMAALSTHERDSAVCHEVQGLLDALD